MRIGPLGPRARIRGAAPSSVVGVGVALALVLGASVFSASAPGARFGVVGPTFTSAFGGAPSSAAPLQGSEALPRPPGFVTGDRASPTSGTSAWRNLTGTLPVAPPARAGSSLAYDSAHDVLTLFGGRTTLGPANDTWQFEDGLWSEIVPSAGAVPEARFGAAFVYDSADGHSVLFGGTNGTVLGDTWTYSNGTWTRAHPAAAPSPRFDAAIAYDARDSYVVLFGGEGPNGTTLHDTWSYSNGTWTNLTDPANGPPARSDASFSWVGSDNRTVLFGGEGGDGHALADTWSFVGGTWTNLTAGIDRAPSPRSGASFEYSVLDGYALLIGGRYGANVSADEWSFLGGKWALLVTTPTPPPRFDAAMGYRTPDDPGDVNGYLFLFGGQVNPDLPVYLADSWAYKAILDPSIAASKNPIDRGETTTLSLSPNGGYGPYNYSWLLLPPGCSAPSRSVATLACRPSLAGSFAVLGEITDSTGTQRMTPVLQLFVNPWPILTVTNSSAVGSPPLRVAFSASVQGGTAPVRFAWAFGDGGSAPGANVSHTYRNEGNFTANVWANDSTGASVPAQVLVRVAPLLLIVASVSPTAGPAPLNVTFRAFASGGIGPYAVSWHFGDGGVWPVAAANHTFVVPGSYSATVVVRDSSGVIATNATTIDVTMGLAVAPSVSLDYRCALSPFFVVADFTAQATGGAPPYTFAWSFGDGSMGPSGPTVTHAYRPGATYVAVVTVRDATNATSSASLSVPAVSGPSCATSTIGTIAENPWLLAVVAIAAAIVALAVLIGRRRR